MNLKLKLLKFRLHLFLIPISQYHPKIGEIRNNYFHFCDMYCITILLKYSEIGF